MKTISEPKEYKWEYLSFSPEIIPVNPEIYQDEFLYGKSIEKLDKNSIKWLSTVSISGDYNDLINLPVTTKKYCFATFVGTISATSASSKTSDLTLFETNDSGMSVTNHRITITTAGQYMVTAMLQFASNTTGAREAFVRVNGSTIFADSYAACNQSDNTTIVIHAIKTFAVNDYIELKWYQTSGGNLNIVWGIANTFLSVHQI